MFSLRGVRAALVLEQCAAEWKVHLSRILRGTNIGPSGRVVKL